MSRAEEKALLKQHMAACRQLIKQEVSSALAPVVKVRAFHHKYRRFYPIIAVAAGVFAGWLFKNRHAVEQKATPLWRNALEAIIVLLPLLIKERSEPTSKATDKPETNR